MLLRLGIRRGDIFVVAHRGINFVMGGSIENVGIRFQSLLLIFLCELVAFLSTNGFVLRFEARLNNRARILLRGLHAVFVFP